MKIQIEDILIQDRIRQDVGDLSELISSIKSVGLIHPIVLNEKYELLTGYRRLQACKLLGWETVDCTIVNTTGDAVQELDYEYHENIGRKSLSEADQHAYDTKREQLLNPPKPSFWEKVKRFFRRFFSIFKRR